MRHTGNSSGISSVDGNAVDRRAANTGGMLEMLVLAVPLLAPPELDWNARKRLLRERLAAIVALTNTQYERNDRLPRMTFARLHARHAEYDLAWDRLTFDLESVHDPEKFWHVYRETVPHEWAHKLDHALNDARGHGSSFEAIFRRLTTPHPRTLPNAPEK